nr:reverse transcriptase domain-containing protein [Tanacetum cinerariifolium]
MQTRSSSRLVSNPSSNPTPSINPNPKGHNHRHSKQRIEEFNLEELSPPIVTMADQRTMTQLLQAPIEGYEDAIVVSPITADNFELKHDSLNSAAGGNFLDKMPRECLAIIESKSKVRYLRNKPVVAKVSMNTSTSGISPNVAELKDMVNALLLDKKSQNQALATMTAVEESCVTCGGAHSYRNCPATDDKVYRDNIQEFVSQASAFSSHSKQSECPTQSKKQSKPFQSKSKSGKQFQPLTCLSTLDFQPPAYQAPAYQAPAPQTQGVSKEDFSAYVKTNDAVMRNMQTQGQNMQNQLTNLTDLLTNFMNSNSASTLSSGTLPINIIANPRSDLKAITTRSGVSYDGPQIPSTPSFLPKVVKNKPEATKDTVTPPNNRSTEDVQPPVVLTKSLVLNSEPVNSPIFEPVASPKPNLKSSIPYPSRRNDERNCEKANNQIGKFYQIFQDMRVIGFSDMIASGNPTPYYDPIVSTTSPTLTSFENSDFLLEEVDAFLALEDDPTSPEVDQTYVYSEGDILLLEAFLNDDPLLPPPNQGNYLPKVRKELKIYEAKSDKSSIDEPPKVELKDLPPHLEYAFLEDDNKLPVIIVKDLSVEEKTALITVLKSHKRAIA